MSRALGWLWPESLAGRITLTMLAGLLAFHLGHLGYLLYSVHLLPPHSTGKL